MKSFIVYAGAAFSEIAGCFAFWAWSLTSLGEENVSWKPAGPFFDGKFPRVTPGSGNAGTWSIKPAFPDLVFEDATVLLSAPASSRLYVGSQRGLVSSFDPGDLIPSKQTFLDLRGRVQVARHGGFLGMAFHPEFGDPASTRGGFLYVYYTAPGPFLRLSRLDAKDGVGPVDIESERVMLNVRLVGRSHRGGGMTFGNDGFLYLSIGDQYQYETAQDIVKTLEGGILRIDVDSDPERSFPPRRRFPLNDPGEISGVGYGIPRDNPFLDPGGGIFEEYFTLGNRNTHRLTNDKVTGRMWFGDVGQWRREEINVIERGANYGWPFREGTIAGEHDPPAEIRGNLREPLLDFARGEAASIIGGHVYRGSEHPDLWGAFLCGDYMTNRIWAVSIDEAGRARKEWLTQFHPGRLSTFGVDAQGEIYLCGLGEQPLFKLAPAEPGVDDPPARLSALGVFKDLQTLERDPAFWPYALNQPSWADGAIKRRWMAIPESTPAVDGSDDEKIRFSMDSAWRFPVGTVFIKHFEMPLDERRPEVRRPLETRFLVHGEDGRYYGLVYKWRPDGSEADLLQNGAREWLQVQTAEGKLSMEWHYPSRNDCLICHNTAAGYVLGMRTRQLNRASRSPLSGREENQLQAWNRAGLFTPALPEEGAPEEKNLMPIDDESFPVTLRAQAYLDVNCAYCHQPGGAAAGDFDLRFLTPDSANGLVEGEVADGLGLTNPRLVVPGSVHQSVLYRRQAGLGAESMPPVGHGRVDREALRLMARWIEDLIPDEGPGAPRRRDPFQETRLEALSDGYWLAFRRPVGGASLEMIPWESSMDLFHWEPFAFQPEHAEIVPVAQGREDAVRLFLGDFSEDHGSRYFRIRSRD